MVGDAHPVEVQMVNFYRSLSEKDRRRYAAVESDKLGHGGVTKVASLFGCDLNTIRRGMEVLQQLPYDAAKSRVRKNAGSSTQDT